uniref:Uncharacterized protein n=1 Tax=uncultured marine virus TaxID=186617 RepID=A0A0F7L575_9VIRU|nr:hypothetical protein [uncultured marine virus]
MFLVFSVFLFLFPRQFSIFSFLLESLAALPVFLSVFLSHSRDLLAPQTMPPPARQTLLFPLKALSFLASGFLFHRSRFSLSPPAVRASQQVF